MELHAVIYFNGSIVWDRSKVRWFIIQFYRNRGGVQSAWTEESAAQAMRSSAPRSVPIKKGVFLLQSRRGSPKLPILATVGLVRVPCELADDFVRELRPPVDGRLPLFRVRTAGGGVLP